MRGRSGERRDGAACSPSPGSGRLAALAAATLTVCAPLAAQQKVPLVLHSLVLTLDSATYADVVTSKFIQGQFAASTTGMLLGQDGGTGTRLIGKYNYLVISPPATPRRRADAGVVLLTERRGGLAQLKAQGEFRDAGVSIVVNDYVANTKEAMPEGDRITPAGAGALSKRTEFEIMQYTADAAQHLAATDSLPPTNLTNSRFLRHYFDSSKLFDYITGATLAIPVDDIAKIVAVLTRDNVPVTADGEGAIITLDGFTLRLVAPYRGAGVRELQFALTRAAVANPTYRFGPRSQLRFGPGLIAVWDFESK